MYSEKVRVLLVDSLPLAQRVGRSTLEGVGCQVDVVDTADAAIGLAQLHSYDVILLETELPDISGFELARLIRHIPRQRDIPILGLSAHRHSVCAAADLGETVDLCLLKPLTSKIAREILEWYVPGVKVTLLA